jgi:hypothetical protein
VSPFWADPPALPVHTQDGRPMGFTWQGVPRRIARVGQHWRVHTAWWEAREVWRDYWQVATDDAYLCVLYHDLLTGRWHLERVLE